MPALNDEPALIFWLDYAERQGALVEKHRDHALVLLPEPLQCEAELTDEATVTASPDVAREDDAVLLIAGHPAVDRAAASVLAEGDSGYAYLPWPASRPPSRSTLEAHARELAPIDQGRIDAAAEPIAAYLPLLRAGATVSYAASLTLRFQEQEEAWVDARTGSLPSDRLLAAVQDRRRLSAPDGPRRTLEPDLTAAIAAAHTQLEWRAVARERSLALHARRALDAELIRADAYYEATLESIARRRSAAPADRARMLDTQAEATQAERARRRREIEEEYRPRHDVRPFRLHLVCVPAYVLQVDVRRGSRTFRSEFAWVPAAGEFAAIRCPACAAVEPLVATRERLGCRACTAPARAPASRRDVVKPPDPSDTRAPVLADARAPTPADAQTPTSRPAPSAEPAPATSTGNPAARPPARPRSGRPPPPRPARHQAPTGKVARAGDKLAFDFWRCVASGDRWPRQKAARDSPLRAVYRLYGHEGPLRAIGLEPGDYPESLVASTFQSRAGDAVFTVGSVTARGERYPYTLAWRMATGKPVIGEVMPAPHPLALPPVDGEAAEVAWRLRGGAPAPLLKLDAVASRLWSTEPERSGLPFTIRCLATWWRIQPKLDDLSPTRAIAAAVAGAVARCAGNARLSAESTTVYDAPPAVVTALESLGGPGLDPDQGW